MDQSLQVISFTDTPVAELRRTVMTPRVDYQISSKNTLSIRYSYNRDIVRNTGTGGLNLSSRGYHYDLTGQTVQMSETSVLNASTINETRFQYFRPTTTSQANTPGAAIDVLERSRAEATRSAVRTTRRTTTNCRTSRRGYTDRTRFAPEGA